MTQVSNGFEGGTNGTTASTGNTGGPSGTAFDNVTIGASATLTFDNTQVMHGSLAAKFVTPASAVNCFVMWQTPLFGSGGSSGQVWFRVYCYLPSLPASSALGLVRFRNSGTLCGGISINASGKVLTLNAAGATQTTSTAAVSAGSWFRLEGYCIGSATVGQIQVQIYTGAAVDSVTPTETDTTAATLNTTGVINQLLFGNPSSLASFTVWCDDLGGSTTAYLGPGANLYGADTGTGADTATVNTGAQVTGADTGTGVDTASVAVPISAADTGSGADTATVNTGAQKSGADTGTGVDNAAAAVAAPPIVDPGWQAARAGMPGDSTATNHAAQIGQFLATHGITPVYQGTQLITPNGWAQRAGLGLYQYDFDQPFTMPAGKTTVGRVALPLVPVGNGADVLVSLYTDSSGSPGSLITQTRLPASWLYQLTAPNGFSGAPELATAANNQFAINYMSIIGWTPPAVGTGFEAYATVVPAGRYIVLLGGMNNGGSALAANVTSIDTLNGLLSVPQPPLPVATFGACAAATPDTIVVAGGSIAGGAPTLTVWAAPWDPLTGTVQAWTSQTAQPVDCQEAAMAAQGENIYMVGGWWTNPLPNVYWTTVSNGQVGAWNTGPPLPKGIMSPACLVVGNWLIVVGGVDVSNNPITNVYYAAIRPDGSLSGWYNGPSLPSGMAFSAPGSGAVATDSGVLLFSNSVSHTQNLMHLTVTPDGLASAWQTQNFAAIGFDNNDPLTAAPQNGFWTVTAISTLENDYFQGTMSVMPILSVPLPATGLTPGSTYHVVIHQIGGDLNDYVEVAFLQNCLPLNAKSATPGSGGPWTTVSGSYELPIQVFDQTPGGKILHTWEDSGARITSLITAQAGSQLLGLCEATQFADGSWLAAVSEIEYGGMVPAGVTQLA